jgi:hypothetical protein
MKKKNRNRASFAIIPAFTYWYPTGGFLKTNEISISSELVFLPLERRSKKQGDMMVVISRSSEKTIK